MLFRSVLMCGTGVGFSVEEIVERLDADIGVEELPLFADLERRMKEMAEKTEQGNA